MNLDSLVSYRLIEDDLKRKGKISLKLSVKEKQDKRVIQHTCNICGQNPYFCFCDKYIMEKYSNIIYNKI